MTSNQRRPGFRLPWSSEEEAAEAASQADNGTAPGEPAEAAPPTDAQAEAQAEPRAGEGSVAQGAPSDGGSSGESEFEAPAAGASAAGETEPESAPEPGSDPAPASEGAPPAVAAAVAEPDTAAGASTAAGQTAESSVGFMRDLVAAMRRVAEEARQASLTELRAKSEDRVRTLQAETENRSTELRTRADADIAAVGEWERTEQERIKQEAEQKVVARRAQLDQQLAAESSRAESAAAALRERLAAYERELDTYHAQLNDIADPAAFAAAAKRMPPPPDLGSPIAVPTPVEPPAPDPAAGEATALGGEGADGGAAGDASASAAATTEATQPEPAPDAESVTQPAAAPAPEARRGETAATEVLVKGLGSFGAITGFRQALASVEGIDGVSLSLGPTGEFVFRAIHAPGFDVAAAITSIEGDAKIEERPEGGIRVTLERSR